MRAWSLQALEAANHTQLEKVAELSAALKAADKFAGKLSVPSPQSSGRSNSVNSSGGSGSWRSMRMQKAGAAPSAATPSKPLNVLASVKEERSV